GRDRVCGLCTYLAAAARVRLWHYPEPIGIALGRVRWFVARVLRARMRLLMPWPCGSPRGSAAPFERSRLCRLDPDAAAVHLHNLLGDGETKPGAALGLGVGAVDLVELLENAGLVLLRNAGPVSVTLTAKWPLLAVAVMHPG